MRFQQALADAEYPIELASAGKARLQDGVFEESAAPGSETVTRIYLSDEQAYGDMNSDGLEDAAVILVADPGGSGTFTYLSLVLNEGGEPRPASTVFLGDRILVKSVSVENGTIAVTILNRSPEEPMNAEPSFEKTHTFSMEGQTLIEAD